MKEKVLVATDGIIHTMNAKTAHGLIRGSDRFEVMGIIDANHVGKDAGVVLDGKERNIPIYASVAEALTDKEQAETLVIGVATVGGVLSEGLMGTVRNAISHGLNVVNGLHDLLSDRADIAQMAADKHVKLTDIRKPRPIKELHFWTGTIYDVKAPIIAVLGMDCAVGKRTVARMIMESAEKKGIKAQMIFTGQTGWMQGSKYGFIFDSTLNDFVSGELEHTIVSCWKSEEPDLILLEGQSSLRNPSGPCGLEFLISGNAKYVILVHAPNREFFDEDPKWGRVHSVASEIEIIEKFGSKVIALALNTKDLSSEQSKAYKSQFESELRIPVVLPVEEGLESIIPTIKKLINED